MLSSTRGPLARSLQAHPVDMNVEPLSETSAITPRTPNSMGHERPAGSELDRNWGQGSVTVILGRFSPLVERGLLEVLGAEPSVRVLACDLGPARLERAVVRHSPSVAVVDETVEYALLARLKSAKPAPGVIVLANSPSPLCGTALLELGATCVAQDASASDFLAAVYSAAQGEHKFLCPDDDRDVYRRPTAASPLTPSEAKVFGYLRLGWSYPKIGRKLHISPETVRKHTANICRKLKVSSRLELIGMRVPAAQGNP